MGDLEKGPDGRYKCLLAGYAPTASIRWETSAERDLEEQVNQCDEANISLSYLKAHMKKFGYYDIYPHQNGFEAHEYPDANLNDDSPGGRIILVFHNRGLAAVMFKRSMTFQRFKAAKDLEGYHLILTQMEPTKGLEAFLKLIIAYSG